MVAHYYYYCCSLPLESGSIIKPGNWGRIMKKYTPHTSPNILTLTRELIFEQVRFKYFSGKPSRFESIFICPDEDTIINFRNTSNRVLDIIYKVELVDSDEPQHRGDYNRAADIRSDDNFKSIEEKAKDYWQGNDISNVELVTTSRIRIVEMTRE